MITRTPTPTEHKLLLLHAIDKLGPVTAQQLLRFMVETELMDYITLQLSLAELVDAQLLCKLPHAIGTLYSLSGKGVDALRLFLSRIPHSRLSQIDSAAAAWRARFMREQQVLSDWHQEGPAAYLVRLRVLEMDEILLDMTLSVPTRDMAQEFCAAWESRASALYKTIMRTLGESNMPPQPPSEPLL